MFRRKTLFGIVLIASLTLYAAPVWAAEKFLGSKDASEKDEPQKFLNDYDKLVKGKDADWVYFPNGGLKSYKTVSVKEFDSNGKGRESRDAAREGKDYMEQWLDKQGYKIVKSDGDLTVEGNVFNAWEPHGAARYWGGWMANPGVGLEVVVKDSKGNTVAEIRHKAKGSTIRDAVENGLEEVAKSFNAGK
jgi:hypothetical protein